MSICMREDPPPCMANNEHAWPAMSMLTETGSCPIIPPANLSQLHFPIYKLDTSQGHTHNLAAVTPRIRKR